VSPLWAASSMANARSGTAACTSRMACLRFSIAAAPVPAMPNWCSTRSGAHSSSTTAVSPAENPSANIRRSTVNASEPGPVSSRVVVIRGPSPIGKRTRDAFSAVILLQVQ
jgi:hypothetical protein